MPEAGIGNWLFSESFAKPSALCAVQLDKSVLSLVVERVAQKLLHLPASW
jgi:hypothetical protein